MNDFIENALKNELTKTMNGTAFYVRQCRDGQVIADLTSSIKELIAKYNLSASEAKGFLDYMKIVIDYSSYLPQKNNLPEGDVYNEKFSKRQSYSKCVHDSKGY